MNNTISVLCIGIVSLALNGCDFISLPSTGQQANAGCLLEHKPTGGEHRILMVQQHNGEWNFPGGGFRWREKPAETAARETQEETGVKVKIDQLMQIFDNGFHLFQCSVDGNSTPEPVDTIEVLNARWVNPMLIPAVQWRFPYQRAWLMSKQNEAKPSSDNKEASSSKDLNNEPITPLQ